ncbi:MAG: hypothetical protein ABL925_02570 [Methylococcales bacterium]
MTIPSATPVFIYTALACEAKPLLEYFKLKKITDISVFSVYSGHNIHLIVTGLGKNAMAAAVAYSQALLTPTLTPIMLNIGIAGHKDAALGALYLVDKNTDTDSLKTYYPPIVFKPPCPTSSLQTSAQAQLSYAQAALYDMEASAFYETAARFTYGELSHSLKIISDNRLNPADNLQPNQVSGLIATHVALFAGIIAQLRALADQLDKPINIDYAALIQQFHFTVTEQLQLKHLLARWAVISAQPLPELPLSECRRGKDVLRWLDKQLSQLDFYL